MPVRYDDVKVKKPGSEIEWTPGLVKEFKKCKDDFFHFCQYVHVVHPDQGKVPYVPRWYQEEFLKKIINNRYFIGKLARQTGKAQDLDSIVWDQNGKKRFGDLKIGDSIYDDQGKLTKIKNIYPQGIKDIYEIEFSDGSKVKCCDEHLWEVTKYYKPRTVPLSEIRKKYLDGGKNYIYHVKVNEPVEYPSKELKLDPYLLGLIIGDGSTRNKTLSISTKDNKIINYLYSLVDEDIKIKKSKRKNKVSYDYMISKKNTSPHKIIKLLKNMNLMEKYSYEKFIPKEYLYGDINQRISLLQGLMDTDGTSSTNQPCYCTTSKKLADDFKELCNSLGIITNTKEKTPKYTYKGKKLEGKLCYIIRLYLKNDYKYSIFRIKRKQNQIRNKRFDWGQKRGIKKIRHIGKKEAQCIEVDNDTKLYLTDNYIPTHNTISISVWVLYYAIFNENKVVGIVSNKESSAKKILKSIKQMYEDLPSWMKPGVKEYNMTSVEFENGTTILTSATTDDAFRGFSLNVLLADEFAFVNKKMQSDFWSANWPTLSASESSKMIIISTPFGLYDLYHKIFTDAKNKLNSFVYYETNYKVIKGRGKKWVNEQIRIMGKQKFKQEHECVGGDTFININNNNKSIKIRELYQDQKEPGVLKNDKNIKILTPDGYKNFSHIRKQKKECMKINFYENIEPIYTSLNHVFLYKGNEIWCYELKSGDKLDHEILEFITIKNIEYIGIIDVYDLLDVDGSIYFTNGLKSHNCNFLGSTNTVVDSDVLDYLMNNSKEPKKCDLKDRLKIWEPPKRGERYIIGVDVGKGTGEHDSVCQIFKVTDLKPFKMRQVAVFQDNETDVYDFSSIIYKLAIWYNRAHLMVENNAEGSTIVSKLWWDFEYENLVNESQKSTGLGIRATTRSKSAAVIDMKKLIENGDFIIIDEYTIKQLSSFVDNGNGKYGTDGTLGDDLVSALYWVCYVNRFPVYDEDMNISYNDEIDDKTWGIIVDDHDNDVDEMIEDMYKWI